MPSKSPAQHRLMVIAASKKGGFGGVPQKVGKDFVKADKKMNNGGIVKSLKNSGFYEAGKTKPEREKIVSKVTTKPQRVAMVEKLYSAKKMAGGGLYANIAAKKQRIASGSGEKMRSQGSAGAPKKSDFANAAKTAKFAQGGKSTVNAAGNYTKPELRKRIFNNVKAAAIVGTGAGQWSARKAQVVAQRYKKAGGSYK